MADEEILIRIRLIIDDATSKIDYEIETREGEGSILDPITGDVVAAEKIKVRGPTLNAALAALETNALTRKAAR